MYPVSNEDDVGWPRQHVVAIVTAGRPAWADDAQLPLHVSWLALRLWGMLFRQEGEHLISPRGWFTSAGDRAGERGFAATARHLGPSFV